MAWAFALNGAVESYLPISALFLCHSAAASCPWSTRPSPPRTCAGRPLMLSDPKLLLSFSHVNLTV